MKNEEFRMGLKEEWPRKNEEFSLRAGFFILHSSFFIRIASFRLGVGLGSSFFILPSTFTVELPLQPREKSDA